MTMEDDVREIKNDVEGIKQVDYGLGKRKALQNIKFYTVSIGVILGGLFAVNGLMARIHGKTDTSQNQSSSTFRNMTYQDAIKAVSTPEQATSYVREHMIPTRKKGSASFKKIHERRYGNCGEAVVAAAALLSDDGFPATYLSMKDQRKSEGHAVFLYQSDGKWGTIGINARDNQPPVYTSLEEIARGHGYDTYRLATIGEGIIPNWIDTDRDLTFTPDEMKELNIEARFQRVRQGEK